MSDSAEEIRLAMKIANRIADAYNSDLNRAIEIARTCDEVIDRSGNLLGWLREYAEARRENAE